VAGKTGQETCKKQYSSRLTCISYVGPIFRIDEAPVVLDSL